ncbi:DNA ligase D [Kaistella flava (ex Peng et al. 2021)]|uniref:DNA ligase (ATP) n=1 Tax=Kaistella flava (ex Peng et al. 2021) TaxID=2038776 RepID=A0A7M2Y731_9FLAO|nr:DNA ligase D [Kaistella flava (ex Peng et al. 2021)]QOW09425.1 DNA ligase D [Kaistella flava (ex Peng et al. 2021)]
MPLEEYNKKRKFDETSEPEGKENKNEGKLIFVIQRHSATRLHYDFRLEMDGVLKSWAVPKGPSLNPQDKRLAMMTEDHPYSYKDFEGAIPEGNYGGGEVEIWDSGTYEPLEKVEGKSDDLVMRHELHQESLKFVLHGKKLKGEFALVKIKNSKEGNAWLLIKHKDKFALAEYDSEEHVPKKSKVTLREENRPSKKKVKTPEKEQKTFRNFTPSLIGEKKLKDFIKPMLAQPGEKAFDHKDWVFEIKWDGYRAVADLRETAIQLYSRNGLSYSDKFSKIVKALDHQNYQMVLDGEIVAYNKDGKPDFQTLQKIGENPDLAMTYQVFDLLWLNGHSTENLSLFQRKELLKDALIENEVIKYCEHIPEKGIDFFDQIKKMELEGMIAKKSDSTYSEGVRSSDWLKIKFQNTEDVLICGFTEPNGGRKNFGAIILGTYIDGQLEYCGHAGTGFSDKTLDSLHDLFKPLITKDCPFKAIPKTNAPATWMKPELVCEIKYTEKTKDGIFRHPVFMGLRSDKDKEDLIDENTPDSKDVPPLKVIKKEELKITDVKKSKSKTTIKSVKLTNQNKIYFPESGITKGEVVEYYQSVAKYILPHLKNRPQSLNRFPNGIEGLSFYHKDAGNDAPAWIDKVSVFSESNEKNIEYLICNTADDLAYLNNLGCIDLNPWNSTVEDLNKPTWLALDLDPSDKNTFDQVIETALCVKEILDLAKIKGFCKTSGSSGIHIFIPMEAKYEVEQVKNFAHVLMQKVQQKLPDLTTLERNLKKRGEDKIYLDYLQNRTGQTLASVYSIRPKPFAPVSMPLIWEELKFGLKPTDFNIHNALERIKKNGDLFKPVLGKGIDMLKALENLSKI